LAVRSINFRIARGEVVSIIGPSGCGKSTLLNMGAGLSRPSAGQVRVGGEPVTGPNKHVAFMLQKDLLMPWRTIADTLRHPTLVIIRLHYRAAASSIFE
jgi:NitT/TauT family transport system ATP-binding protein